MPLIGNDEGHSGNVCCRWAEAQPGPRPLCAHSCHLRKLELGQKKQKELSVYCDVQLDILGKPEKGCKFNS
jgi:hypothetical protein